MKASTPRHLPLSLAMVANTILAIQSVIADGGHEISLTENSDTSLSATYDGSSLEVSVFNTGTDRWTVLLPASVDLNVVGPLLYAWLEPDTPTELNLVEPNTPAEIFVSSDIPLIDAPFPPTYTFLNGAESPFALGVDTGDGGPIFMTFTDNGDSGTVPETGATGWLMSLGLAALFLVRPLFGRRRAEVRAD